MLPLRELLRIARKLDGVWSARPQPFPDSTRTWRDLDAALAEVRRAQDRVRLATRHHLDLTAARLRDDLGGRIDDLARKVEQLRAEQTMAAYPIPALAEWVHDLRQLEAEFGTVAVRWPDEVLRVVTEPIVLEDVELGPFAIEFGWDSSRRFRGARAFEVIALEPNPATGRDDIVHPHVQGHRLCAGDATEPLHQAVDEGRLADAFLLVQSVLTTYNPRSPYVPLSEWDGFHCSNCGRRGDTRDRYRCEGCDSSLCDESNDSCSRCSDTRCPDCLTACDVCDDRFCRSCLVATPSDRLVCTECRTDCPSCGTRVASGEVHDGRCGSCPEPEPDQELEPQTLEETHAG